LRGSAADFQVCPHLCDFLSHNVTHIGSIRQVGKVHRASAFCAFSVPCGWQTSGVAKGAWIAWISSRSGHPQKPQRVKDLILQLDREGSMTPNWPWVVSVMRYNTLGVQNSVGQTGSVGSWDVDTCKSWLLHLFDFTIEVYFHWSTFFLYYPITIYHNMHTVIFSGGKDTGKVVIECHLQDLHATGHLQRPGSDRQYSIFAIATGTIEYWTAITQLRHIPAATFPADHSRGQWHGTRYK